LVISKSLLAPLCLVALLASGCSPAVQVPLDVAAAVPTPGADLATDPTAADNGDGTSRSGRQSGTLRMLGDLDQGFNGKVGQRDSVGFIRSLSIGGVVFNADLSVKTPADAINPTKVVAVLGDFLMATGGRSIASFGGQISTQNHQAVQVILASSGQLIGKTVAIDFVCWQYDETKKTYYRYAESAKGALTGTVAGNGSDVTKNDNALLTTASDPSAVTPAPINYRFMLSINAGTIAQTLAVGRGAGTSIDFNWGGAVK
jgi:hypothetical protein